MNPTERRHYLRVVANHVTAWGLPAAVLFLAFIGYVSYQGLQRQLAEARWVEHTHAVLANLEEVVSLLKDAETGARGFVITGEERYLATHTRALNEIHGEIGLLRNLLADHPAQLERLNLLESLAASRLIELDIVIESRRESDAKAVERVRSGRGKLFMDEIRGLHAQLRLEEERLLSDRAARARESADTTLRLIMFGTVASLVIVLCAFVALRRENSRRLEAQRMAQQRADEVEDLYNRAPCGYHSLDKDGVIVRINDTELEWLGYAREEIVGRKKFSELLTPESAARFAESFPRFRQTGRIDDIEFDIVRRDGTLLVVSLSAAALRDADGNYLYSRSTLFDVTERRLAQRRVAAQHAVTRVLAEVNSLDEGAARLLQAVCENMRWEVGTLWRVDQAAGVLRCVEIWHMPSFDAAEFRAFTAGITFAPGQGMPGRAWQSGKPFWVSNLVPDPAFPRGMVGIRYGLKAAFGFPIWLHDEALGVIDFFGSEIPQLDDELSRMFSAIGSQIGQFIERKRAEAAVRQSEQDMRFLQSVTLEISQAEDSRAAFNALLKSVCDFTGWAYGQAWLPGADGSRLELSPSWYSRIADLEQFRRANERLASAPKTGLLVQVWASKEPAWVWDLAPSPQHQRRALILEAGFRSWMGFPVLAGNDVIAVVEFFEVERCQRDERLLRLIFLLMAQLGPVIQRKRVAEEIDALNANLNRHAAQLEATNRELESFSYSVSHDLRSPLRAIDGFARILKEDYSAVLDSEGRRLLGVIINSSQKMGRLIDDLLDFSRLGRKPLAISRVDMTALAAEVLQQIEQAHGQPQPRVVLNAMPAAQCDPALIRQAWANLLGNAIKFSAKSGAPVVEVAGYSNGSDQIYSIKDNGAGFDMRYYDKLFGVFQRLHSEEEFPGTGVGLAIVQRVVSRHGGRVWAEGEPGKGAIFYFSLPKVEVDSLPAGSSKHAQGNA